MSPLMRFQVLINGKIGTVRVAITRERWQIIWGQYGDQVYAPRWKRKGTAANLEAWLRASPAI